MLRTNDIYNPSEWSKRYRSEELYERFMDFCTKVTREIRETIPSELNIPYGTTERTKYDIYGTDLPKDAPIFIFIHGGYWKEFSKDLSGFSVPLFVKNKIKVITVGYDLCPQVTVRKIVAQIKLAVAQILKYAADSGCKSVWIGGHSAGAHLATSLLHDKIWIKNISLQGYFTLLKGLVLIAGLYDLSYINDVSYLACLHLSLEEAKALSWAIVDEPHQHRIKNLKVIVTVGDCDSPHFIAESRRYAQKIISIVDNMEFLLLPEIDHFDIVENLVDPNFTLSKLLLKCFQLNEETE